MTEERSWKRIRERLGLTLPVRVVCKETPEFEWMEVTRLTDVTPFGAGFILKRPTEKGRLLHMTIPMPRQLRVFDHLEDQYRVWAIVRHVNAIIPQDNMSALFNVGVAFIGKRAPASYEADPSKRYEISTSAFEAMANVEEVVRPIPTSDQRTLTRHNIAVDMLLELPDEKGGISHSERTTTQNISKEGAMIFTTRHVPVGRFLRLSSEHYNITVHAVVRAMSIGVDGIMRIHVEFIDREWPL